ncbi:tetratricopeptide repeat protein [Sandaracinus amylolyticus]|uniref:Tetratricopeptide repeat protein n=1 Tax=Sandaracinus amylolyticus TaxID=927083 RepID=A0A0F6YMJ6_9BACT|nr:hypothetical protein [Sandaracinus amylolyticus]AKF10416.1 hypothetical protein DB32_007565 [Sandaracinus amylolyticus]
MKATTRTILVTIAMGLGACSGGSEAPPTPTRPAAAHPTTPPPTTTPATSEPTATTEPAATTPPTPPPAPEPAAAQADPLRARIQADPNDAQARCELGWLYFDVGNLDGADAETRRGVATLENDFRLADASKRNTLGACLYNRGRIAEARARALTDAEATRTGLTSALGDYERSLWYRENEAVRGRWNDVATELGRRGERPETVPATLWTYATGRENEVCGAPVEEGDDTIGEDSTEGSCAVHVEAVARGRERRQAAVISIGDYDDAGTPDQVWDDRGETSYELLTFDGQSWITRGPVYSVEGMDSTVTIDLRFQDVQPGGDPEVLVVVEDEWYMEADDDEDYESTDTYGTHGELSICGVPEGATDMLCAEIVTREESHGGEEERVESVAVRFAGEGRVTIRGRMEGERVREETTVAQIWTDELAARERAALEAQRRAQQAATPPPTPPREITGTTTPTTTGAPTEVR